MAGGGVGEASLVFGGWQPRGQPESFRSVEAHLGLGRFTLISKQEQKVSAWCAVLHLPWMPQQRWGSVVDHSWGSSCPVCARPLRTPPPFLFHEPLLPSFFPLSKPDSISLSNCCLFSGTQPWGHSLRHPAGLTAKGKEEGSGVMAGSKTIQTSRPVPLTSTLAHFSN